MRAKLLVIGPTPPPFHGVSVAMRLLLDSSLRERFQISHVDLADRRGIAHVDKPDLHDVALFLKQWVSLLLALLRRRPALVYLAISQSTIGFLRDSLFIWPARWCGSRVILHLHGGSFRRWYEGRGRFMKAYVRRTLRAVAQVIVLGESLRSLFDGLIDGGRIAVVPNGVPWDRSVTVGTPTIPKHRSCRVLHLGTLNHLKGTLVLVSAVPLIAGLRPDVEFVLAGIWSHAEDRRDAESFIARQGIGGAIIFTGPVSGAEKRALFESADLFVFPGLQEEGQPLVVLEAMAAGLPVLFTDRGCLRETVRDGEHGLEVRAGDPQHLAERMLWLLDRPAEMKAMGMRSRIRYQACYTSERFLADMGKVFDSVAGGPG